MTQIGTFDITPTWEQVLPGLLATLQAPLPPAGERRQEHLDLCMAVVGELGKMARAADLYNQYVSATAKARAYVANIDRAIEMGRRLPFGSDDDAIIHELMNSKVGTTMLCLGDLRAIARVNTGGKP